MRTPCARKQEEGGREALEEEAETGGRPRGEGTDDEEETDAREEEADAAVMTDRMKKERAYLERERDGQRGETNKERGRGETEEAR